jgi:hypothetical protein
MNSSCICTASPHKTFSLLLLLLLRLVLLVLLVLLSCRLPQAQH